VANQVAAWRRGCGASRDGGAVAEGCGVVALWRCGASRDGGVAALWRCG